MGSIQRKWHQGRSSSFSLSSPPSPLQSQAGSSSKLRTRLRPTTRKRKKVRKPAMNKIQMLRKSRMAKTTDRIPILLQSTLDPLALDPLALDPLGNDTSLNVSEYMLEYFK